MLIKLIVRNYILIDELEIDFREGYSAITGETGAGKSIILGALSLILGQRADTGILLDKSKKCVIEGHFSIGGYHLEEFFAQNELDFEKTITLRREINQAGKSRAFIQDTPVNLNILKELGDRLVNIHSQHAIITLNDSNFQLAVIDSYGTLQKIVGDYRDLFTRFWECKKRLAEIEERQAKESAEHDYYLFLLEELTQARLVPGELESSETQLEQLSHAEEVRNSLSRISRVMSEEDDNLLSKLAGIIHQLSAVAKYRPELHDLASRINTDYIDLKDICKELSLLGEEISADPDRMESLSARLDLIYRLMKKHKVNSVEELLGIKGELEGRFTSNEGLAESAENLRKEILQLEKTLSESAGKITAMRSKLIPQFENEIVQRLASLGIPQAKFRAELTDTGSLTRDGRDKVRFLFSANAGIDLRDLSNTASGGELSRLMLTIKSMIGQKNLLPTIIFDEIDNGVSGDVAGKVGAILKGMGRTMQVVAITHLPQIAARGDSHYQVYKLEEGIQTRTRIRPLTDKERVEEVARMLSDETVTKSALKTASELLGR